MSITESRNKTTAQPCDRCGAYNADADGPLLEINGDGTAYECCPNCWWRIQRITE